MATTRQPQQAHLGRTGQGVPGPAAGDGGRPMARLTTEQVWLQVAKASFAVLGSVTPSGEPRFSGAVYKLIEGRLYVAVAPGSWKARHVAASGRVAVTVPVRRGGLLSLGAPIPPTTISFHGAALVHPAGEPQARTRLRELTSRIPKQRQAAGAVLEVVPEGEFLTYGLGEALPKLLDPAAAQARVPVTQEESTR